MGYNSNKRPSPYGLRVARYNVRVPEKLKIKAVAFAESQNMCFVEFNEFLWELAIKGKLDEFFEVKV